MLKYTKTDLILENRLKANCMGKLYGYAPFSGHFWIGERIFWREFCKLMEIYFYFSEPYGVKGSV